MFLSQTRKGVIALVVLAWVFATMGVFARYLSTEFALFEQTYLRIGIAFILGIVLFYSHCDFKRIASISRKDFFILTFRSVCLYLGVVMLTEAFLHTKYSNATFAASLPLLPLFGYIFLKEKIKFKTFGYILLGFFGLAIVTLKSLTEFTFGYGELMAFGSLILFDFSYVGRKWQTSHLNNYETTIFMFGVGALFLFLTSVFIGESLPTQGQFSGTIVITLIVAAIFNVANLLLTNYGFEHVKVAVAGNILMLEAVFALLYGIFLFSEIPLLKELVGSGIILLSVYLVNRSEA